MTLLAECATETAVVNCLNKNASFTDLFAIEPSVAEIVICETFLNKLKMLFELFVETGAGVNSVIVVLWFAKLKKESCLLKME
jgi:hypothetical protein